MYSFSKVFPWLLLAGISAGVNRAAMAQFEVAPDHFPGVQSRTAANESSPVEGMNREISAVQQELEGYYSALQRQREEVDRAQEVAAGAGGMGEWAYIFIDEYVRQRRVLDQLKKDFAPQIMLAQARLDALRRAQMASATPAGQPKAVHEAGNHHHRAALMASLPKPGK